MLKQLVKFYELHSEIIQLMLTILSIATYIYLYLNFHQSIGLMVGAFSLLPVLTISLFYGAIAGIASGFGAFFVTSVILQLLGISFLDHDIQKGNLIGTMIISTVGFIFGRMSDLSRELKQEVLKRKKIELILEEKTQLLKKYLPGNNPTAVFNRDQRRLDIELTKLRSEVGSLQT